MNLLVIGSTGGTGRQIVSQAIDQGHFVTAFARNPANVTFSHERLRIVQGDVLDPESLDRAIPGHDAVLCALGHKRWFIKTSILSEGTRNLVTTMERHGVRRLVCETTLGINETRGKLGLYYTLFVIPFIVYFYFRDKEKQEQIIRESSLDWIIVRPGQLTNGKRRGVFRSGPDVGNYITTVHISRADVADFMISQAKEDAFLRQAVSLAY